MTPRKKLILALNTAISEGKVLDVSLINTDATGIRIVSAPLTNKSLKKKIGDLQIISNNYESYKYAVDLLGSGYSRYSDDYLKYYGTGEPNLRVSQVNSVPLQSSSQLSPPRIKSPSLLFKLNDTVTNAIQVGKVVDVSNLKPNGTGMKIVSPPSSNSHKKGFIENINIVSDNYPAYKLAMNTLGDDYTQYADSYLKFYGQSINPSSQQTITSASPQIIPTVVASPKKKSF